MGTYHKTLSKEIWKFEIDCQLYIQRFKKTSANENLEERDQKPISSPMEIRILSRKVKGSPELSSPRLTVEMQNETGKSVTS